MPEQRVSRFTEVAFYEGLYADPAAGYGYPVERPQRALELARRFLPGCRSVLDVSAGRGQFARIVAEEPGVSTMHVSEAIEGLLDLDLATLPRFRWVLPEPCPVSGSWDFVACLDVLEHLLWEDTDAALRELAAVAGRYLMLSIALFPCSWGGRETHINLRSASEWSNVIGRVLPEWKPDMSMQVRDGVLWVVLERRR